MILDLFNQFVRPSIWVIYLFIIFFCYFALTSGQIMRVWEFSSFALIAQRKTPSLNESLELTTWAFQSMFLLYSLELSSS